MPTGEVIIQSPMASAMGASVKVTGPGRGMYLIIGRPESLPSLVRTVGGEVALRLNGGKMLAALPFSGYLCLRGSRDIRHIGPVSVDLKRLAKVIESLAKTAGPANGSVGSNSNKKIEGGQ